MHSVTQLLIAIAGGLFPALAWLWFWLREDSEHPEPRRLIFYAFIAGMATVAIVIPIELSLRAVINTETLLFITWAIVEELMKFIAASTVILWRHDNDEPIDAVIYMIMVGLGFAAVENMMFLLSPVSGDSLSQTILSGNFRFIGATLLHVLSSAIIGVSLGLSFYKHRYVRYGYVLCGIVLACITHSAFNYSILHVPSEHMVQVFVGVWIGILALLAMLEYVKRVRPVCAST